MSAADPHGDTPSRPFGQLSIGRIRSLSDGIFAFALTVLVLDVRLPESARLLSASGFIDALWGLKANIFSCLLSFVVLAMYWIAHHNTFLVVNRSNRMLVVMNLAFLACVAFVPFGASLLARAGDLWPAIVAYGSILALTSLVLAVMVDYAFGRGQLVEAYPGLAGLRRASMKRILTPVALYLGSISLSFWHPRLSVMLYVALPFLYLVPSRVDRHWAGEASS